MSTDFDFLKKPANTTTISTKELTVVNQSRIDIGGKKVSMTPTAFSNLVENVAGLGKKAVKRLNEESPGAGVRMIKRLLKSKPEDLTLVSSNGMISRISTSRDRKRAVNGRQLHGILTTVLDKSPHLELHGITTSECNTKGNITLIDKRQLSYRLPGEDFQVGYSIDYDLLRFTELSGFYNRLVCSNGMIGQRLAGTQKFDALATPQQWYDGLLSNDNWEALTTRYSGLIDGAINNTLSVNEFNRTADAIQDSFGDAGLNQFIAETGGMEWIHEYARHGIQLDKLTKGQAANCPTKVNRFTAVNAATFMGRNSEGRLFTAASSIGGDLLTSSYDSDNWMFGGPKFENAECTIIGSESLADSSKLLFGAN